LTETLLEVQGLRRSFGPVRAVDDISFSMSSGEIYGFIGPNGAGKTTTMRILATLDLPDAGDAYVDGVSVLVEPREVRNRVGFMSDQFAPYPNLDVLQYLDFFARAYGLRGRARVRTVRSVASFCGLDTFSGRPATGLSKGMGQRLHLAKTMLHDPALLILDEPAAGLDPRARIEFRELVRELAAAGKGVLISSHILSELSETCDGVLVIERGQLMASGSIEDVARGVKDEHRIAVRVLGDLGAAERFFLTQPHVERVIEVEGRIEFDFHGDDEAAADLLGRAVAGGVRVVEFAVLGHDLEEIFMRTTEGRLQ
jgi:ABC-2 type transport system ATP-binding protein